MVDYIADYLENIRDRRVFPDVKPGYMRELVSENPPMEGEEWENIFTDVDRVIMPGVIKESGFIRKLSDCTFFCPEFCSWSIGKVPICTPTSPP
jgi:hypothetical protein